MNKRIRATIIVSCFVGTVLICILLIRVGPKIISKFQNRKTALAELVADGIDVTKLDNIPTNPTPLDVHSVLQRRWNKHLEERAEQRLALEQDTSKGEPIWLSLHAKAGMLKHWAILIHGQKYELRRRPAVGSRDSRPEDATLLVHQEPIDYDGSKIWGFGRYYMGMIQRDDEYGDKLEERAAALKAGRKPEVELRMTIADTVREPEVKLLYIIHLGWTRKSKEEVNAVCIKVARTFGPYSLLGNNCQDFALKFAAKVVDKKSQDWNWFYIMFGIERQYEMPQDIGPPGGIARLCIKRLHAIKIRGDITDPQVLRVIDRQLWALEKYEMSLHVDYVKTKMTRAKVEGYGFCGTGDQHDGDCGGCDGGGCFGDFGGGGGGGGD